MKDKKGCRCFYDAMTHARKIETENKWIHTVGMTGNQE